MKIRQACAYMLMAGGMLLFSDGASQAEQSKSGSSAKQGHEASGKMGQGSAPITEENPGGIVTRGGRGDVPGSSKVDPLSTDQRDDSNLGSKPSSGSRSGNKGSSGSMGSPGGTGSSGGASGGAGGR